MSLMFWDNISYLWKKPLDNRSIFKTIEEMKDFSENYLPSLAICQNEEDWEIYLYNKDNEADETTGKWRKMDLAEAESYLKRAKDNNPDADFSDTKSLIIWEGNRNGGFNILEEISIGFNPQGSIPGAERVPSFFDNQSSRDECKKYIEDNFAAIAAWKWLEPAEYWVSGGWYVFATTNDMIFIPASRAPGTMMVTFKKMEQVSAENVNLIGTWLLSTVSGTTVLGEYNKTQSGALIIGNGENNDYRSDALVITHEWEVHASNYYIGDEIFQSDMIEGDDTKATFVKNKPIYTNWLIGNIWPSTYTVEHESKWERLEWTYTIKLPFDKSKYLSVLTKQIVGAWWDKTVTPIWVIDLLTCAPNTVLYHYKENPYAPIMLLVFDSFEWDTIILSHSNSSSSADWGDTFTNIISFTPNTSFVEVNYDNETITLNEEGQLTANITDDFHVETLPENPEEGMTVQLIGEDYDVYKKGHIYKYIKQSWWKTYKCFSDAVNTEGNYFWTSDWTMMAYKDGMWIATKEEDLVLALDLFKSYWIPESFAQWIVDSFKEQYDNTNWEWPITVQGETAITLEHHSQYDFSTWEWEGEFGWVDIYSGDTPIVEDTFHVTTMPETPTEWDTVQFIGEDTEEYKKGHIYKYTSEEPITYKAYMSEWILYHHNWDKILYLYRPREWDFDESGNFNPSGITFDMLITLDKIQGLNSYTIELNPDGSLKSYCVDMLDFWNSCIENDFESMWWTSLEDSRLPQFDITVWWDDTLKWVDIYWTTEPIDFKAVVDVDVIPTTFDNVVYRVESWLPIIDYSKFASFDEMTASNWLLFSSKNVWQFRFTCDDWVVEYNSESVARWEWTALEEYWMRIMMYNVEVNMETGTFTTLWTPGAIINGNSLIIISNNFEHCTMDNDDYKLLLHISSFTSTSQQGWGAICEAKNLNASIEWVKNIVYHDVKYPVTSSHEYDDNIWFVVSDWKITYAKWRETEEERLSWQSPQIFLELEAEWSNDIKVFAKDTELATKKYVDEKSLEAGDAVKIENDSISVKYDNNTIKLNDEGELIADVNNVVFLTQEEYDELPEEKKEDGTVYSIIGEESWDPKAAFRNPDWSRASTTKISVSGTYTIPEDWIIIFNRITSPNGSTIANFTVNWVGFDMWTNDSGYKGRSAMVAKWDIVEWSGLEMIESPEYTFVPYKIVVTDTKIATNYSTDEVATGMYWIDGKPIYRKVLTGLAYSFDGASWNTTNIDMTGVGILVNIIPYNSGAAQSGFFTKIVSNKLQVYITSEANWGWNGPLVLEYTKTTD